MPSPWVTGSELQADLEKFKPEAGWFLELKVEDEEGEPQGQVLIGVLVESTKSRHGGWQVLASFLSASDEYYRWWMTQGEGKKFAVRGVYHLCGSTADECGARGAKHIHIHAGKSRRVLEEEMTSRKITWLRNEAKEVFEANVAKFYAALRKGPPKPMKGEADPGAIQVGKTPKRRGDHEDQGNEDSQSDSSSTSAGMKQRLKKLRADLAAAEKEREERKGKAAKKKKKKEKRKAKRQKDAKRSRSGKRSRGRSEEKKDRKKAKKRSKSPASEAEKKRKDKRKRSKGPRGKSSSSTSATQKGESAPLFRASGKGSKQLLDGGDRGPFGGGSAVDFDGSSSSEESSFRKGSSASAKSSQMRLVRYAERHPGRLASRLLLKMQEATARGALEPIGESKSLAPAVAQNHLLTVLLPSLGEKAGVRTRRERKTLTKILDSLARGDPAGAADVVAQRVKALERASHEAHWGTAQYLELLPPGQVGGDVRDLPVSAGPEDSELRPAGQAASPERRERQGRKRQRREEQEGERTRGSEGGQESVEPERLSAAEEGPADTFVTTKLTEWQDVIREFMAGEHSPAGLVSKLLAELPALPTVLGRYCRDLKQKELEAFTKGAREAVMPKDILPISLAAVREFLKFADTKQVRWVELMVVVLNRLYNGGSIKSVHVKLSRPQESVVSNLLHEVQQTCKDVGKIQTYELEKVALGKCKFDYAGEPVAHMEELTAEKVIPCWPKVGEAAVQDVVNLVTKEVREWLEDPTLVLLPPQEWPDSPAQSRVRATDEEWEKIVTAAHERGMMLPVKEDEVFRDHSGTPALVGSPNGSRWGAR